MKKILVLMTVLTVTIQASYAAGFGAYDAGSINSQYMRDLRTHEMVTRTKNKSAIVQQKTKAEQVEKPPVTAHIKKITFINNEAIPTSELEGITSGYLGKLASDAMVSKIRKLVSKYYQSNGYFSAIVIPNVNNLTKGELIFEIKEGTKNSIVIE
jgi:hemolysin activation/secretion protein